MSGKFIVIEGIDGAGGETQTKLLTEFLQKNGKNVLLIEYPDYTSGIGKLIQEFLHNEYDFSADVQFSLFATDMIKDKQKILDALNENKIVISNRYLLSTLAYQSTRGFQIEKGLEFAENFELPKPDLVIYIDIDVETSMKRKMGEKNNLDRHESDKKFLEDVRSRYLKLAIKKIFANEWVIIDGKKSIEEVAKEIREIVLKFV